MRVSRTMMTMFSVRKPPIFGGHHGYGQSYIELRFFFCSIARFGFWMRMLESEGRDVGKSAPNQGFTGFCWEVHTNDPYLMLKSLAIYGKSSRGLLKSIISGGFGGNPQLWRRHGYALLGRTASMTKRVIGTMRVGL